MQQFFELWVLGVLEDSPLPYEVTNIYFCLHKDNFFSYLSFGGSEFTLKKLFNFWFYPLDGQFFDLKDTSQNFNLFNLRKLIENALKNKNFKSAFKNKKIFYGNYKDTLIYKIH